MLFGQYLIDRKVINQDQLVQAMISQLELRPSLLSILHKYQFLAAEQLNKLLAYMYKNRKDIMVAISEMKLLDQEKLDDALNIQAQHQKPLGLILVDLGFVESGVIKHHLQEFLNMKTSKPETTKKLVLLELPVFVDQTLEAEVTKEYTDFFDDQKKSDLENSVLNWDKLFKDKKEDQLKEAYRNFYRELHTIKGTARFLKAQVSEFLIHKLEDVLSDAQVKIPALNDSVVSGMETVFLQCLDRIWDLRNSIKDNQKEYNLWNNQEWQESAVECLRSIQALKSEVEALEVKVSEESFASQF